MKSDTRDKIIAYIRANGRVTPKDLVEHLGISKQAFFVQASKLLKLGELVKTGKPPRVYYSIPDKQAENSDTVTGTDLRNFINERYLYISPLGEKLDGVDGFSKWCHKTGQRAEKTAKEYVAAQKKYDQWVKDGFINGDKKMSSTFDKVYVDTLYYLDFYSIERFGKTKLGQLLLYAKQSQSKTVISELTDLIRGGVYSLIKKEKISSVGFVPATVRREVQLMKELESGLALPLRKIKIAKVQSELMVPQKTLVRLPDRIENAARTIVVEDNDNHENILIIDDAVGSGATLNETARQIREKRIVKGKIIGLAIVGSFKGFDVISEV
jgi:hypothetical protein